MLASFIFPILSLAFPSVTATPFEQKCLSFNPLASVPEATRNIVQFVTAGTTLTFPDNDASCSRASQVVSVDLCRIALSIPTSTQSNITFEAWFPEEWAGRFLATGNGGIDGCIKYEDLAYTSQNGFAAVGANNGKNGTGGLPYYNHPQTVIDFAWRSLHTSVVSGKALTKAFYGAAHQKSYYLGCSLGGRQGVNSADMFPSDFDGIVAGAPAVDFNNLVSWRARFFTITGAANSSDFISATAWKTWIHDEVLRQCDAIDGVRDGIIEDPTLCKFDPSLLLCAANSTQHCLSQPQVAQLTTIFSDYTYPDGTLIYPAMQPGSEIGTASSLYAGAPWAYSEGWFRYVVYNDPTWDASSYSFADARAAENLNPGNIRTWPPSLSAFEKRGSKMLIHHGQQDTQISSLNSIRFYEHLRGERSAVDMDAWLRFFRLSGMNHCSGGPGAWVVGQGGNAAAAGIPFEKEGNVLKAVVDWVEQSAAPDVIRGTKFVNDTVKLGVDFMRLHCRYPLRNTFIGGDNKDPLSWKCR